MSEAELHRLSQAERTMIELRLDAEDGGQVSLLSPGQRDDIIFYADWWRRKAIVAVAAKVRPIAVAGGRYS